MNYSQHFRVPPGTKVKLKDIDPGFKDLHESHKAAVEEINQQQKKLLEKQELLNLKRPEPKVDLELIRREYHAAAEA